MTFLQNSTHRKAVGIMKPNMTPLGDVPDNIRARRAIRLCKPEQREERGEGSVPSRDKETAT